MVQHMACFVHRGLFNLGHIVEPILVLRQGVSALPPFVHLVVAGLHRQQGRADGAKAGQLLFQVLDVRADHLVGGSSQNLPLTGGILTGPVARQPGGFVVVQPWIGFHQPVGHS